VINDEENFKILLNKSSYIFYEFYTLSQYMADEELDSIEKVITEIGLIKYGDSLNSMIKN
jgi:hypothetical protein